MTESIREPQTPAEWNEAAALAEVMLDIDAARRYGLITGGPKINVERCRAIIRDARAQGIVSTAATINRVTEAIVREYCK
jgi:hypothetical protein